MDSLTQLVDVLALDPSNAAPRLRGILSLCSQVQAPKTSVKSSESPITVCQLDSILGLARFLAASKGQFRGQLLPFLLNFLKSLLILPPGSAVPTLSARPLFFPQLLKPLFELALVDGESQRLVSEAVTDILQRVTQATRLTEEEPLSAIVQDFLLALSTEKLPLSGADADNVSKWLYERWVASDSPSGALFVKENGHGSFSKQANGSGNGFANRSPSSASLSESGDDSMSEVLSRGSRSSDASGLLLDEAPLKLELREWAFRIFAQLLPQARAQGGAKDTQLLGAYRERASKQLKAGGMILQPSVSELPPRKDMEARFQASSAAAHVLTALAEMEPHGGAVVRMASIRHATNLLLDVADAAILSRWRHFPACHQMVASLLACVVRIACSHPGPLTRDVFVRMRSLMLNTAVLQSHKAGVAEWAGELPQESDQISPLARSAVSASAALLKDTWPRDEAVCLTFMLALGSNARPQEGDSSTTLVWRRNLISLVAELALASGQSQVAEALAPQLLEILQDPRGTGTGPTRLRLLDALAKVAGLGMGTAYREVVVLLVRLYLTHVQRSMEPAPGAAVDSSLQVEGDEALPAAFLHIAQALPEGEQRNDYRVRLLALASDVGLIVESRDSSAGGARCLGRLLPAIAELCRGKDPTAPVSTQELKLFRNMWFYIALLGLGPPLPGSSQSVPRQLTKGTAKLVNTSMRAVTGPYSYPVAWVQAVETIAEGTPPLVVSSMQWVEDEEELTALHQPGSRSGSGSEKAAMLQRAALASALANKVDANALLTISGVKATYLLAVTYLEILRLFRREGVLSQGLQRHAPAEGAFPTDSWLACTFKYLEASNLTDQVRACLEAVTARAFTAGLSALRQASMTSVDESAINETVGAHACFLVWATTHFSLAVADVAHRLLTQLRSSFPQILWHPRCVTLILDLLGKPPPESPSADPQMLVSARRALQERIREWLSLAVTLAPATMQGLLQEHLQRLQSWPGPYHSGDLLTVVAGVQGAPPPGSILAAAASAAAAGGGGTAGGAGEGVSAGILAATIKSKYAGEVAGMRRLYHAFSGASSAEKALSQLLALGSAKFSATEVPKTGPSVEEFDALLVLRFVSNLEHCRDEAQAGRHVDQELLRDTCLRGAALLLASKPDTPSLRPPHQRLLRLLAWCPVLVFTPASLELGVFIWTWLLAAAPPLTLRLFADLIDAWLHCAAQKRGLFSTLTSEQGERALLRPQVTPGEPEALPERDPVEAIHAHRVWLGFLQDRFQVARHGSREQLALFGRLFSPLSANPPLTRHPAASGTVFSYLLLGLDYCAVRSPSPPVKLVHDGILRAAFSWFEAPPAWYDHRDVIFERAEALSVREFGQALESGLQQRGGGENVTGWHPVWGKETAGGAVRRVQLLAFLVRHEVDRLATWADPLRQDAPQVSRPPTLSWTNAVSTAWDVSPRLALALVPRFPSITAVQTAVTSLVGAHIPTLINVPEALPFFVTPAAVAADSPVLSQLVYWAPCSITQALDLLTPAYAGHPRVMAYVLRVLQSYPPEAVMFFMPQLVQALRYDSGGLIEGYLMAGAQRSNLFAHRLIWQLQGEEAPPPGEADPKHPIPHNELWDIVGRVKQRIIDGFIPEARSVFEREFRLFDGITAISGKIKPLPKEQRRAAIKPALEDIHVEGADCYLPTAPDKLVVDIERDSGVALQSAAKAPFLLAFDVRDRDGDPADIHVQGCIFKEGDDCRQDVLALQVISLLRDIFSAVNLDLYLCPYGVLPTGYERGIIEMVPNTRSRTQMGEITDVGLFQMYQQDYGPVGSPSFEEARNNFIVSAAGYAVASLILQPKDRHNGNLLYDNKGRLVHIDFGFILEISPGGNMRFESADFKLSHEMTQLLDPSGAMRSDSWNRFVSLCVKGYLAARVHAEALISTVHLMVDSGLPCFSRGDPMGNLRKRFHLELTEREAANFMIATCVDAYNKWTTSGYDVIQYLQQDIQH